MKSILFVGSLIAVIFIGFTTYAEDAFAEPTVERVEMGVVDVERDNGSVKKCELSIPLMKLPESLAFRVKSFLQGKVELHSFTIDVVQFRVSNAIPYDPVRKPITSARIISNTFDSDKFTRRVVMGDGGLGYIFDDDQNLSKFTLLMALLKRGDYYIQFKRSDKHDITSYVVSQKVDDKFLREFLLCAAGM